MRVNYDQNEKTIEMDFEGTLILTRNNYGISLNKEFVETSDFKSDIRNVHVQGRHNLSFKNKLKLSIELAKWPWRK